MPDRDTEPHRLILREILETGLETTLMIRDLVADLAATGPGLPITTRAEAAANLAHAYDQAARAVRRTILLAQRLDDPPATQAQPSPATPPANPQTETDPREPPRDRDPVERLDPPDPDPASELPDLPTPTILAGIRRELDDARPERPPQAPAAPATQAALPNAPERRHRLAAIPKRRR